MSDAERLLDQLSDVFEQLVSLLDLGIEQLAEDDNDSIDLKPLRNARDLARHGAQLTRKAAEEDSEG